MRKQREIVDKINSLEGDDFFYHARGDLIGFLESSKDPTRENVIREMAKYIDFAFEKAEGERGLSAARSMDHYYAWIWLIDEQERFGDVRRYSSYGLPHLRKIKDFLDNPEG